MSQEIFFFFFLISKLHHNIKEWKSTVHAKDINKWHHSPHHSIQYLRILNTKWQQTLLWQKPTAFPSSHTCYILWSNLSWNILQFQYNQIDNRTAKKEQSHKNMPCLIKNPKLDFSKIPIIVVNITHHAPKQIEKNNPKLL